jgi:hypothetical protein
MLRTTRKPFAVFRRKILGGQKSITCVCLAQPIDIDAANPPSNQSYASPFSRIWLADEKGIVQIWNSKELFMVRQLDVKRRVNSMLSVGDTVWVGTIGMMCTATQPHTSMHGADHTVLLQQKQFKSAMHPYGVA